MCRAMIALQDKRVGAQGCEIADKLA